MADVYGRRKMYSSGFLFIILIPIGAVILFYLYDFCMDIYKQKTLDKCTTDVMMEVLNREGLESIEEMQLFAEKVFAEYKMTKEDFTLTNIDDYYLLSSYSSYTSVVGTLSFGLLRNKTIMVHSNYKGYYNEYKEAVVEKYTEKGEDGENNNVNVDDEPIIIN